MKTQVINLYGGPCIGKSTIAAGLFYELKCRGIECEYTGEFAKDKVWENNAEMLNNQPYIFGNQLHRIWRLNGKVKYVICDSPILLSIIYNENNENSVFKNYVLEQYNKFDNINFLIKRNTYDNKFVQNGRVHTESQSKQKDVEIKNVLDSCGYDYENVQGEDSKHIVNLILQKLNIM